MRPLTGKRYCIHVFDEADKPIYYVLADELLMDGVTLVQTSDAAGAMTWAASIARRGEVFTTHSPTSSWTAAKEMAVSLAMGGKVVHTSKGRFSVTSGDVQVQATYARYGMGHKWRLILNQWRKPYVAAKAHERRVDSIHVDPAWFCRPIRGRQRTGKQQEWETKPIVKQRTLVLRCQMCGQEYYPQVPEEQARRIISGEVRAKIPECRRCGGRMALEQFTLNTSSEATL